MFSYAQTGNPPRLTRCTLRGLAWLLASLLWFAPRRKVTMTIEVLDRARLAGLTRHQINPFLEAWYTVIALITMMMRTATVNLVRYSS